MEAILMAKMRRWTDAIAATDIAEVIPELAEFLSSGAAEKTTNKVTLKLIQYLSHTAYKCDRSNAKFGADLARMTSLLCSNTTSVGNAKKFFSSVYHIMACTLEMNLYAESMEICNYLLPERNLCRADETITALEIFEPMSNLWHKTAANLLKDVDFADGERCELFVSVVRYELKLTRSTCPEDPRRDVLARILSHSKRIMLKSDSRDRDELKDSILDCVRNGGITLTNDDESDGAWRSICELIPVLIGRDISVASIVSIAENYRRYFDVFRCSVTPVGRYASSFSAWERLCDLLLRRVENFRQDWADDVDGWLKDIDRGWRLVPREVLKPYCYAALQLLTSIVNYWEECVKGRETMEKVRSDMIVAVLRLSKKHGGLIGTFEISECRCQGLDCRVKTDVANGLILAIKCLSLTARCTPALRSDAVRASAIGMARSSLKLLETMKAANCDQWNLFWPTWGAAIYNVSVYCENTYPSESIQLYGVLSTSVVILAGVKKRTRVWGFEDPLGTILHRLSSVCLKDRRYERAKRATSVNCLLSHDCPESKAYRDWANIKHKDSTDVGTSVVKYLRSNEPEIAEVRVDDYDLVKVCLREIQALQESQLDLSVSITAVLDELERLNAKPSQYVQAVRMLGYHWLNFETDLSIGRYLKRAAIMCERDEPSCENFRCAYAAIKFYEFVDRTREVRRNTEIDMKSALATFTESAKNTEVEGSANEYDVVPAYSAINVKITSDLESCLKQAFRRWRDFADSYSPRDTSEKELRCTLHTVKIAGEYSRLYHFESLESEAWSITHKLANDLSDSLSIVYAISRSLTSRNFRPDSIASATEHVAKLASSNDTEVLEILARYGLCLANYYYEHEDYEKADEAFVRATNHVEIKFMQDFGNFLLAKEIEMKYRLGRDDNDDQSSYTTIVIQYLYTLLSMDDIVETTIYGRKEKQLYDYEILLDYTNNLALRMNSLLSYREISAHLTKRLGTAQKLACPLRVAECLKFLCYIDLSRGKLDDCEVKLQGLEHILEIEAFDVTMRSKLSPCGDRKEFSSNFADARRHVDAVRDVGQSDASPVLRKKVFAKPDFMLHGNLCSCFKCANTRYQYLVFSATHVRAQLFALQRNSTVAFQHFHGAMAIKKYILVKRQATEIAESRRKFASSGPQRQREAVEYVMFLLDYCRFLKWSMPSPDDNEVRDVALGALELCEKHHLRNHPVCVAVNEFLFQCRFEKVFTKDDYSSGTEPWIKSVEKAERGSEIPLPCILKSSQCGGLHSIKWYHGNTRIFIFSESAGITRENNDLATRATMDYDGNTTQTYLRIPDVKLEDEGLYKCEATYLSVNRECNNVQHITLTVNVRPDYVRVTEKDEKVNLTSGETLGPINEGKVIRLRCESGEGKPIPTVEWYRADELLEANSSTNIRDGNMGTGSSELQITVGRNELDTTFTCKVSSPALDEPLTLDVKLDVHVSPKKMDVKGVVGHVVSGTKILLECIVSAARPPANVTWYNGTEPLSGENERLEMFGTNIENNTHGTFDTASHLAFTACEYDNGRMFSCYAENSVMMAEGIKPMKEVTIIEVLYPPIVALRQENITVNETDEFDLFCDYVANPSELKAVKWLLNGELINVAKDDHYDGGVPSFASLTVRNSSSTDMGKYTCILENSVGESTVEDFIDVSVLYKPQVRVTMEPEDPVNEADRLNVSLTCEVVDGNPMTLTTVRWFLDGDLLKELPDCSRNSTIDNDAASPTSANGILVDETSTFCDIDPSKLLLEAVGRSFNGNYACEGRNDAGWGNRSASTAVVVYYKPGPATITYEPKRVVKKGSLNITCSVLDVGRPPVKGFKWFRGSHQISGEESAVLRIDSVNLETKANFTCMAFNEAGGGDPATVFIDVAARPDFIKALKGYAGFAYNSTNVSIECWVECSPICNISWTRDGLPMNFDKTNLYYQTNVYHPPDQSKNDFESIQSTLVWNMTAWPDGHLHPFRDNENFTCESTGNGIGPGVKSETVFRVEFPPENMTISKKIIDVVVDSIPESVKCSAVAEPEPMFRWFREGSTDIISTDAVHVFKTKVPRRSNGTYICQAHNRHGQKNITTYLNVLFKPECRIDEERIDGEYYLVCSAIANPKESDFAWSLKSDNDTLDQIGEIRDGRGYLRLDTSVTNFRTYVCVANNSIGFSLPCERGVPGNLPWWLQLQGDLLIIVIIVAMVVLLAIVICCIVIWLICRRKRAQAKYPSQATNNNHVDSVSESLPEPETKTFYENLPFHGIQTPPNKLVTSPKFARVSALHGTSNDISIINSTNSVKPNTGSPSSSSTVNAAQSTSTEGLCRNASTKMSKRASESTNSGTVSPCSSQPASLSRRTSLCGASSGYESATNRSSHLGPHYSSHNMPRTNSPEPKYNTLKPLRRRKHKQTHSRFYSLRLCRKHSEAATAAAEAAAQARSKSPTLMSSPSRRNYQLYAIPIIKSCPHKATNGGNPTTSSTSTIATTLKSTPDMTPTSSLGRSKPSSPLPTPPPTPPTASPPHSPTTKKELYGAKTKKNIGTKIPPIPAPRTKKTDPSRHTYQNVPPPIFPSKNKKNTHTDPSSASSSSTNTKHKI